MIIKRRLVQNFDWLLFSIALLIPIFGLVVLYSAGYNPDIQIPVFHSDYLVLQSQIFVRQLIFFISGIFVLLFGASVPTRTLQRYGYWIFGVVLALLVVVLVYGRITQGSQRWLSLGGYNLQPSEFMKIAMILCMAKFLARNPPRESLYGFVEIIVPLMIIGAPMVFVMLQPDLGTSLAIGSIGAAMLLFIGVRAKVLGFFTVSGLLAAAAGWFWILLPYQKRRILTLFNPEQDPQGSGWHIIQSKIAVGSGELFGKGFLQGSQSQLEFLPERTTDFIFSVLAEEWGFLGCMIVLATYGLLLARMLRMILKIRDVFSVLVIFGVSFMIFFHVMVNIGMVIGYFPVVGLPLPMFSYGGSAMFTNLFSIGIVLGLIMRRSVFSQS